MRLFTVLIVISLFACTSANEKRPESVHWLLGTWENQTSRGRIFETWKEKSPAELMGKSYFLNEGDTVIMETIRLVLEDGNWIYVPTVVGQNEEKPVPFRATIISDTLLIFENPNHDFPQRITYQRIGTDSLLASISGVEGDQAVQRKFPMRKRP